MGLAVQSQIPKSILAQEAKNVLDGKQSNYGLFDYFDHGPGLGIVDLSNRLGHFDRAALGRHFYFVAGVEKHMSDVIPSSTYEDFIKVIDKLVPKAKQDVLDFSVFIIYRQTRKPAPWRSVLRGAFLFYSYKISMVAQKVKRQIMKIIAFFAMLFFMLACTLTNSAAAQISNQHIETLKPTRGPETPTSTCTVSALETLNLRTEPGTYADVIAVLNYGDVVTTSSTIRTRKLDPG